MFELVKAMFATEMAKRKALRDPAKAYSMADKAIDLTVTLIVVAIGVGAIGAGIFFTINTTAWDTTSRTVWPYVFVIIIAAIIIGAIMAVRHRE